MATANNVTLATLIRGKSYKQFWNGEYLEFKRNVPREVDEDLADELEILVETKNTEDGDAIEMDRFRIERNQKPLAEAEHETKRRRLRLVSEDVPVKPRKAPTIKAPPPGFKRRTAA